MASTRTMVATCFQNGGAVALGTFAGVLSLAATEWASSILHPPPADFGGTEEEISRHVAKYPAWVLALLGSVGWGGAMVASTFLATRLNVERSASYGVGVGLFFSSAAVLNMNMLPYPRWYWVVEGVTLPLGVYLGVKLGVRNGKENYYQLL